MRRPILLLNIPFLLLIIFLSCLCLLHEFIHLFNQLLQLADLEVLFLQAGGKIVVVFLHLLDKGVAL